MQPAKEGVIVIENDSYSGRTISDLEPRLQAREAQRAAEAAKRLEDLEVASDPRESVESFLQDFSEQRAEIAAALEDLASASLEDLGARLDDLEHSVASAAYFLPPYDLRQATLALQGLREGLAAATAAAQPRRKFAFAKSSKTSSNGKEKKQIKAGAPEPAASQQIAQAGDTGRGSQLPEISGRTINSLQGTTVVEACGTSGAQDYTLTDLEDCKIFLLGPLAALFMHRLRNCTVVTGPVAGATFVEGEGRLLHVHVVVVVVDMWGTCL